MLAPILDPATVHPTADRILAVQYVRPKQYGSLYLPESYDKDGTWNWWECVKAGPDVEKKLGIALAAGDIFRTPWRPAIDLGAETPEGRRLFIVGCTVQVAAPQYDLLETKLVEELNVTGVIPKTWEEE